MLTVMKFGGSSLANREKLLSAASSIVKELNAGSSVAVVVSAMGDTTDELTELAKSFGAEDGRELAALMSSGEQQSAALMAIALQSLGIEAQSFAGWQAGIITAGSHTDADIVLIAPIRIESALKRGVVPVIAGFQGMSPMGDITTLGRGGSDTTAVALAAALSADKCLICTDVDGIYTADPRLVRAPAKLGTVDIYDMLLLSRAGSQVLHSKCLELAELKGVAIELCGADRSTPGTLVRPLPEKLRPDYAGVTRDAASGEVTVVGKGAGRQTLELIANALSAEGIVSASGRAESGRVSVLVAPEDSARALALVHDKLFAVK